METSGEAAAVAPEAELRIPQLDPEQPEGDTAEADSNQRAQAVQTEIVKEEMGINTDPDWEDQVAAMFKYTNTLEEQYNGLLKKQAEEEKAHEKEKQQLQKKKEESTRQHQALLDKLESVRVKRQLNNSKATRKNFVTKKQELMTERNKAEEDKQRVAQKLEESEKKLTSLSEEQEEEQRKWQEELDELRQELEKVRLEAQEAELLALRDEIAAVEKQRDVAMARIEAWQREVRQYLMALRLESPQQYPYEKQRWDREESLVQKNMAELQGRFQEVLHQLQQGRELESLPRIKVPNLPLVPMADVRYSQVMRSLAHSQFVAPPPVNQVTRPLPASSPTPVARTSTPPALTSAASSSSSSSSSAGTLDKVLEKLGARYPQCSRAQLTSLLQQVKSTRGTLSGMSMQEVIEQVGQRLAQGARAAAPSPVAPGPIQRPALPPQRAPPAGGAQAAGPRKLCLMCQNHVDPESRHPLSCSHTIHRDCIRVWLQSSKNNSCPFCPGK